MLTPILPTEAKKLLESGKARLVDVREPDEIEAMHVEGCVAAPLSVVRMAPLPRATFETPIIFTCHSGNRVRKNASLLESLANGPAYTLEGGMDAWEKACLPVVRGRKYSLERQVRMVAGSIILCGFALSLVHAGFLVIPIGVGCGLVYAGVSGTCAMAGLLQRLPWNRKK